MQLIEPLRELFKDEVRKLGVELAAEDHDLSSSFPGSRPGCTDSGCSSQGIADTLRLADAIFIDELIKHDLYDKVSQAFAVFLPVRSVGVKG